jgi:hypothetical protein
MSANPFARQPRQYGPDKAGAPCRLRVRVERHPDEVWIDGVEHRIVQRQVAERAQPESAADRELRIRLGLPAPVLTYTESIAVPVHKLPRRAVDKVEINQPQDLAASAAQPGERT